MVPDSDQDVVEAARHHQMPAPGMKIPVIVGWQPHLVVLFLGWFRAYGLGV